MKKRLFSLLLAVLMLLSLAPGALAADLTPAESFNDNTQSYSQGGYTYYAPGGYWTALRWADVVRSYLYDTGDARCRVEFIPGTEPQLVVETYSDNNTILSQKFLDVELPLFGGFFAGKDANYFVFGQENPAEDDSAEIIRIVKYSKKFERLGSASIKGNNTTVPFDGGSLRFAEDGAFLYVHTCHEIYAIDGVNHQTNLTFVVRKSEMTVTDIRSTVMNSDYGYVSHSFNQFVIVDGEKVVTLDHGDANPRAAYLYRMDAADRSGHCLPSFYNSKYGEGIHLMTFASTEEHYNYTGASLGGLVASGTHYLAAGSSVDQAADVVDLSDGQRNIFVCAVPKDTFDESAVKTYWLTNYPPTANEEEYARVSTPQLVLLDDGRSLILWTLDNTLYYQYLAEDGSPIGTPRTREGALSDCAPRVIDGLVQWYVTKDSAPTFYAIDPKEETHITHVPTVVGRVAASCEHEGYTGDTVCSICGTVLEKGKYLPAVDHVWDEGTITTAPTCVAAGERTRRCIYGCGHMIFETIPALGHDWGDWTVLTLPTETEDGWEQRTCARCLETEQRRIPMLNHEHDLVYYEREEPTCTEDGAEACYFCGGCGLLFSDAQGRNQIDDPIPIPALGHHYVDIGTPPTCTEYGDSIIACDRCGDQFSGNYNLPPLGHDWGAWSIAKPATEKAEGLEQRTCVRCGEKQTRTIPKLTPSAPPAGPANPFVDVKKGAYYYDPVLWALNHKPQITDGVSADRFAPDKTCTRGQVVTFLWRAAGCPEPKITSNPFRDVKPSDYFCKAVLWAVENGITDGTSATTFSPNAPCTRAHVVTFLWRAEGNPTVSAKNPFRDVKNGAYYYDAVLWAGAFGITDGTSETTFSPDKPCTRGQIVTFLYRDLA